MKAPLLLLLLTAVIYSFIIGPWSYIRIQMYTQYFSLLLHHSTKVLWHIWPLWVFVIHVLGNLICKHMFLLSLVQSKAGSSLRQSVISSLFTQVLNQVPSQSWQGLSPNQVWVCFYCLFKIHVMCQRNNEHSISRWCNTPIAPHSCWH